MERGTRSTRRGEKNQGKSIRSTMTRMRRRREGGRITTRRMRNGMSRGRRRRGRRKSRGEAWEGERAINMARRTMAAITTTVMTTRAQANQQYVEPPCLNIVVGDAGLRL